MKSMIDGIKTTCIHLAHKIPLYKILPPSKYRDYAAVRYLTRAAPRSTAPYLKAAGRLPTWRPSSMIIAAADAYAHGQDELAMELAAMAIASHPENIDARLILADLLSYHGSYPAAFRHAYDAWLLSPQSVDAATRAIRLSYFSAPPLVANNTASTALERFHKSEKILWAACKHCPSIDQFNRIMEIWQSRERSDKQTSTAARPLAYAALHLGLFQQATDIYARACLIEVRGTGVGSKISSRTLAGTHAMSVLTDLQQTFESSGIPFFFAAGTALGIVRDGRPIDHDDDIDVGVFEENWDRERIASVFRRHPNFDLEASHPDRQKIRLLHRGGAGIDIFKFYRDDGHVFHDGNFVRWKNSPFSIESHATTSGHVPVPCNSDKYLTENYGEWRVPDRNFDAFVHAPNMEITSTEYWKVHRIRRAYRHLRSGSIEKARQELPYIKAELTLSEAGIELIRELQL